MKRFCVGAMIFSMVLMCGCFSAVSSYKKNPSLAQYSGELKVSGLNGKVDVYRDQYGIPHVFTEDEHDMFFTVGYLQAQDRLWEMVLLRAVGQGRMSEIFGKVNLPGMGNTFQMDKSQRIQGLKWLGDVGEPLLKEMDPASFNQINAYCEGVNAFITTHQKWEQLPVELQVLRVKPEPWRVSDIISYNMFIGQMLGSNMDEELFRYGLIKKYGADLAWKLFPLHFSPGPTIVPTDMLKNKLSSPRDLPPGGRPSDQELGFSSSSMSMSGDAALKLAEADLKFKHTLFIDAPMASNDWIVSGKLTESGHAMLANDPHLEHMEPSLFYPIHLQGAGIDAYGVAFAGVPFPVLGHTRKISWGATTPATDVQDLFMETVDPKNPGRYRYKGEWREFTIRKEIIRVRVGSRLKNETIEIRQSVHGPIINEIAGNLPENTPPLAMRWTAWDFSRNLKVFDALIQSTTVDEFMGKVRLIPKSEIGMSSIATMYNYLLKGDSYKDFIKAMDAIVVPGQNWVGADADGHIIYLPGGFVPMRKKGIGVLPVSGENGEFDWSSFIPLMELPYAIDPDRGYMATANNTVVDQRYYPYIINTRHDSGWRAWRIEELIKELAPLSMDDMKRIQNDVQVKEAKWEIPIILAALDRQKPSDPLAQKAAEELSKWDCEASLDATAVVIFYRFNFALRRNVLEDEVPAGDFDKYLNKGAMDIVIHKALSDGESPFFDDKSTQDKVETMDDMIVKSLRDAMSDVEKTYGADPKAREWGKLHTITWENPIGIGPLKDLSVGPFPHIGADETVRAAGFRGRGKQPWVCLSGPVLRHIIDMGDPERAQLVIDGSVSGQWLSPHYKDLHVLYNNSQYVTATMDKAKAVQESKYHLVLQP